MIPTLQNLMLLLYLLTTLRQNAYGSEIINGEKVPVNKMLYMASVRNESHVCGGFLISKDFVMTAAHCDFGESTRVILGTHNLKKVSNDMRYTVTRCKHPDYMRVDSGNDIMLLKLNKKIRVDRRSPKPVLLPKANMSLKDKTECVVAGWGLTKNGGKVVDTLQMTNVSIINQKECLKRWNQKLPQNVVCAGGYRTNKGFCQGDSGGPLVCKGFAVGVVSYNYKGNCNYPNKPNVYTDISKYMPWINKILKQKGC